MNIDEPVRNRFVDVTSYTDLLGCKTLDTVLGVEFYGSVEDYLVSIGETFTTSGTSTLRQPLPSEV